MLRRRLRPEPPAAPTARAARARVLAVLALTTMLVAACGAATPTSGAPTASTLPASAGAATSPSAAPSTSPGSSGPHLTYVALGDSLLYALADDCNGCTSAAVLYGRQMAKDLRMPVEVHNLTMHNGLTSSELLSYLDTGARIGRVPEDVDKAVAAADVISVTIGFNDPNACASPDLDCYMGTVTTLESNLEAILSRIETLRAGKPTALRVTQIYNNGIGLDSASDIDGPGTGIGIWKPVTEAQNAAICRLAAKHHAVCVDIYSPFNGPDGTASPIAKGMLGHDDTHPSQVGMDAIAAALVAAGYAPLR